MGEESQNKSMEVIFQFGLHPDLCRKIANVILNDSGQPDNNRQLSLFPINLDEIRVFVENVESARTQVSRVFQSSGVGVEVRNGKFIIVRVPDEEDVDARKAIGY